MKIGTITFTKDGECYLVKERTPERSTMYKVLAQTEQEARHLFEVGSHLVTFVGSVNWR